MFKNKMSKKELLRMNIIMSKYLELIDDLGYDYDGLSDSNDLKGLIDELTRLALKADLSKELKEDSIAHKIKNYFELGTYQNSMLFKYDEESKKLLVSKAQLEYLLSLCNDAECQANYDMEIVDEIKIIEQ